MKEKVYKLMSMAFKMCHNPFVLKNRIFIFKPFTFNIDKTADIRVKGKFILNNEWNSKTRLKNKTVGKFIADENCKISIGNLTCYAGTKINVGKGAELIVGDCFMNYDCVVDCTKRIEIGENTFIGERVKLCDSNKHSLSYDGFVKTSPIKIGTHVWICNDVTILSGVEIGDGAVIAAGSVVTKNVSPKTLVGGIPAKTIREQVWWKE